MVKLGCSFSGKPGKDLGAQDGAAMDIVPLISSLDVSQLPPPFPEQVIIKTQTEYHLSSPEWDLEAQKLNCSQSQEGCKLPAGRMIAFVLAFTGCVLIMYKAIWYDQFTCPDGFLLRHKICTPLTLEMYYTELAPERHHSVLAAIGAYPLGHKYGTEIPLPWAESYHTTAKENRKGSTQVEVADVDSGKPPAKGKKDETSKVAGSLAPLALQ
ncbi:PREDICTED: neuron-specific vesicular protein calcyon [Elephantulus edwardii]|uniref:neuron-specific vesicular protein calcyon n=1 Tax=Elephantulus edwardii TaxID=28737 RepID=UPI0003F0ECBB|nr:PREDICTED: neuron-specific vesicular protein calcyon [Elephantulus edwardii]